MEAALVKERLASTVVAPTEAPNDTIPLVPAAKVRVSVPAVPLMVPVLSKEMSAPEALAPAFVVSMRTVAAEPKTTVVLVN